MLLSKKSHLNRFNRVFTFLDVSLSETTVKIMVMIIMIIIVIIMIMKIITITIILIIIIIIIIIIIVLKYGFIFQKIIIHTKSRLSVRIFKSCTGSNSTIYVSISIYTYINELIRIY